MSDPTWERAVAALPQADIYFSSGWHAAAGEALGEGAPELFVFEEGGDVLVHPYIRRPVAGTRYCDLESAYGYSGPLATTTRAEFLAEAWASFSALARDNGVVAEFIRFHPLAGNHCFIAGSGRVMRDRETVVVDLSGSQEDLMARAAGQHRRNLRKAQDSGIVVGREPLSEALDEFRAIYAETMDRAGADSFYRFGDAYFRALAALGEDRIALFVARQDGEAVAAALVLLSAPTLHYHLGGAHASALGLRPMNALFHGIFVWGQENGYLRMHLGGGRTSSPDDSLLRFKSTLGSGKAEFHIGRRIHDAEAYEGLAADWCRRAGTSERPPHVLLYRLPVPAAGAAA